MFSDLHRRRLHISQPRAFGVEQGKSCRHWIRRRLLGAPANNFGGVVD